MMLRRVVKADQQPDDTYELTLECGHRRNKMRGFGLWVRCYECVSKHNQHKDGDENKVEII